MISDSQHTSQRSPAITASMNLHRFQPFIVTSLKMCSRSLDLWSQRIRYERYVYVHVLVCSPQFFLSVNRARHEEVIVSRHRAGH